MAYYTCRALKDDGSVDMCLAPTVDDLHCEAHAAAAKADAERRARWPFWPLNDDGTICTPPKVTE